MESSLNIVIAWSYGLAGVGYALFALRIGVTGPANLQRRTLLAALTLTSIWGFLGLAFALSQAPAVFALGGLFDVLRMGGWFAFLLSLILRPEAEPAAAQQPRTMWLAAVAVILVGAGLLAQAMLALRVEALGDPGRLNLISALTAAVLGLVLVEQLFRNVPEDFRWNIKPLCVGLGGAFIFDIYLFAEALLFNRIDADVFSVRGFVYALAMPLVAVSTMRNRDWTLKIALSRRVVFHSAALMATGVYLLMMAGAGYYARFFGGEWGRALQIAVLFAALLLLGLLVISGSIRAKLRVMVSKHFFSYRYDYRDEWLRFTQALSSHDGKLEMGQCVIRGLADMVESPAGGLWLKDSSGRQFVQSARWNIPANLVTEPADGAVCGFLSDSGWVINLEEFRVSPERYSHLEFPRWLAQLPEAWLIVPLRISDELIGFVVLTTARTHIDVNWEVNDLLKTAGRQAASFLGQMQATEALMEARKFDAFNRMSAFVVHDLKNIVSQLSLMQKNAERHRDNPEFQRDMLMTVEHSVDRMKQLMMQLREGTRPVDAPHGVDLAAVIGRIQRAKADQEPVPELELLGKVAATGHADRLERVIGHLVQNAIDATGKGGRVWIKLARQEEQAMVEVGDTGHGMTPEFVRERLFKPFQTTKKDGMGIGAYESFQYVQELGGRVQVDSTPDVGTCVRLLLPLFDAHTRMTSAGAGKVA